MAFWLRPGERSGGHLAYNRRALSEHLLTRRVRIGYLDLPHVLDYRVTFTLPEGEHHTFSQFEALTGYMPKAFSSFFSYNVKSEKLEPLDDGPGEQARPVVLSTPNGSHAMGAYSPQQPSPGFEQAGYGRFRFAREKVVKWNSVFRVRDRRGVKAGEYHYRVFVAVGTRRTVEKTLTRLHAKTAGKS